MHLITCCLAATNQLDRYTWIFRYVLTASHCTDGSDARDVFVRVGDHDNSDPNDTDFNNKQTFGVKKIIMHSGYDAKTVNNDVALLKLDRKIDFKYFKGTVAPICLPETVRAYSGEEVKNHKQSF